MEYPEEKIKKYWIERCCECGQTEKFVFIKPDANGSCTMIYNIKTSERVNNIQVYYNNCRQMNPGEYVLYKLLGVCE